MTMTPCPSNTIECAARRVALLNEGLRLLTQACDETFAQYQILDDERHAARRGVEKAERELIALAGGGPRHGWDGWSNATVAP